jgi:hypothetical protein
MTQALSVVHVFVSGKPPEDGLPQQPDQRMTAVPASACLGEQIACHGTETECPVKFAIGQQSRIGGNYRAAKLEHQSAVEIEPENPVVRITRRVRHCRLALSA